MCVTRIKTFQVKFSDVFPEQWTQFMNTRVIPYVEYFVDFNAANFPALIYFEAVRLSAASRKKKKPSAKKKGKKQFYQFQMSWKRSLADPEPGINT